ncbi:hypothetical protein [Rhizosphaericola mali]|uniref:Uncharacterized protein n=1 Tax=Rhizosphaericola mali TaxID=2545455 RepID=A0A5P2FZV0_9BACT|nr:hypothetical protein [Rhizosphaericola mali]QES88497.1 hypothetical protein E0W69_007420 [Rhizosphaericola mali]
MKVLITLPHNGIKFYFDLLVNYLNEIKTANALGTWSFAIRSTNDAIICTYDADPSPNNQCKLSTYLDSFFSIINLILFL